MILLDTNVISEIIRPNTDATVAKWMQAMPLSETGMATPTIAELLYGLAVMPKGMRRKTLTDSIGRFISRLENFPFDS